MFDIFDTPPWSEISFDGLMYLFAAVVIGFAVSGGVDFLFRRIASRSKPGSWRLAVVDSFNGPLRWSLWVAFAWMGWVLFLGNRLGVENRFEAKVFFVTEMPFVLWFGLRVIDKIAEIWAKKAEATETTFDDQLVPVGRTIAKVIFVSWGIITIAGILEWNISSVLAGFGIGGAALALASKDTIANIFGSIVIFVDRPFHIGDWVEIGAQEGTVEEVGLRVTRIRTFANSLITVPNSQLTVSAINNWSRMEKRRIKMTIGLTYDTTPKQMRQAVQAIRDVLKNDSRINQDFWLVNFTEFGPYSLDIFIYCFTKTTRWDEYLHAREDILLQFMDEIEKLGLSFAFPTQTIQLDGISTDKLAQMAMKETQGSR